MAATSVTTLSPSMKHSLVSPPTLYLSITKAIPSVTPSPTKPEVSSATVDSSIVATTPAPISITPSVGGMGGTTSAVPVTNNSASSLQKSIVQQRRQPLGPPLRLTVQQSRRRQYEHRSSYGHGHPLLQQVQNHLRYNSQSHHHLLSPGHKKTHTVQLAGKLEGAMASPMLQVPMVNAPSNVHISAQAKGHQGEEEEHTCCSDYVYTAPCEHHPSKGQTEYLINDMFPKLEHDLSTIEFGIRISDFMPLAFKTVPVAGLAEKELELLHGLRCLPNVIQLQDSFVNDNGDTVLVLPMLKRFDCHAVNQSICSIRKTMQQILTGLAAVHAKNIVHLDINPSNLMVTHTNRDVVIIDFGLSMSINRCPVDKTASQEQIPACGTTGYMAPEVMNPTFYETHDPTAADLYSLGVVLGEMLEAYIPDCDLHYFGSKYLTLENTNQAVKLLKDFMKQDTLYPRVLIQAADLLKNMLQEDPRDRMSAQALLDSHPFLMMSSGSSASSMTTGAKLDLCDWMFRVQEIKYQKYLYQEQNCCEVYRYR